MDAIPKGLASTDLRLMPGLAGGLDKLQELQNLLYAARDALARGEALSTVERQRLNGALDDLMALRKSNNAPPGAPKHLNKRSSTTHTSDVQCKGTYHGQKPEKIEP